MSVNSIHRGVGTQFHGYRGDLTPQQKLFRGTVIAVVGVAALYFATKLYTYCQLSWTTEIQCTEGEAYYQSAVNNSGNAKAKYCLAGTYKTGNGVEKSLEKARKLYREAYNQGLSLAKEKLCAYDIYADWSNQQRHDAISGPYADICCPSGWKCTYPWWEIPTD